MTGELLPWARRELGATTGPRRTVAAGQSYGGLAAANLALRTPEAVGGVIAQSGSFWWPAGDKGEPGRLTREVLARPRQDLRFYLDVGDREIRPGPGGAPSQVQCNRDFRDALRAKGYPVTYAEYHGGHDYVNWRTTFADALLALLGKTSGRAEVG